MGTFVSGEATSVDAAPEVRYARLSFELERCGPMLRTTWYDAANVLIATDELEVQENRLIRYRYWRPNIGEWASVVRKGAKIRIERSSEGRLRSAELAAGDDIAVGPMMAMVAERGLGQLAHGVSLSISYAVPEQFAAYDFTLTLVAADGGARHVRVEPGSWLLRKLVRPVNLHFDASGAFSRIQGRVLPVAGSASAPQPLEVDAQVLHRGNRACLATARQPEWERLILRNNGAPYRSHGGH